MHLRFVTRALLVACTGCSLLTSLSGLSGGDATEPFPIPRLGHQGLAYGGYVYVLGGEATGTGTFTPIADVYFAKIGSDGKLGLWKKTSALPEYHAYAFALVAP